MKRTILAMLVTFGIGTGLARAVTFTWSGTNDWNIVDTTPPLDGWDDARGDGLPPTTGDTANAGTGQVKIVPASAFNATLNMNAGSELFWPTAAGTATAAQMNFNGGSLKTEPSSSGAIITLNGNVVFNTDVDISVMKGYLAIGGTVTSTGPTTVHVKKHPNAAAPSLCLTKASNGANGLTSAWDVQAGAGTLIAGSPLKSYNDMTSTNHLGTGNIALAAGTTLQMAVSVGGNTSMAGKLRNNVLGNGKIQFYNAAYSWVLKTQLWIDGVGLSPGTAPSSAGTLTLLTSSGNNDEPGEIVFTNGASLKVEIGGTTDFDAFAMTFLSTVAKQVRLEGVALNVSVFNDFKPAPGDTFKVINVVDSAATLTGVFSNDSGDRKIKVGQATFTVSYSGGDGNDVVLSNYSALASGTGTMVIVR